MTADDRESGATPDPTEGSTEGSTADVTELADLRVVVDRIEGRSVCGLAVGDHLTVTQSSQLRLPEGGHFCIYALAALLPLLPAKQRALADGDWLARDCEVACPDPQERLVMRIEAGPVHRLATDELT